MKTVNVHSCAQRRFRMLTPDNVEELRKYVAREWSFLSTLDHPNIVSAKDDTIFRVKSPCRCGGDHSGLAGADDDVYVLIMERMSQDLYETMHFFRAYVPQPTRLKLTSFSQLIYSRLPPRRARSIFYQICKALDYLHQGPILHRDISWGNIMLRQEGEKVVAKLVDLGLSRDLPKTQSGLSVDNIGTVAFCAPELHSSEFKTSGYGTRVDVWSLGIVLYLLLTGNSDPNERGLRFKQVIDAIENDHDDCMEHRERGGKGNPVTCLFCEELCNDRFVENVGVPELQLKKQALTLLEGMLKLTADERFSIKAVLRHPWLAEERAQDPQAVDTEEETLLFHIPRRRQRNPRQPGPAHGGVPMDEDTGPLPPLKVSVKKFEYPYLRDPECTVLASSLRSYARDVKLGDGTTFGGILSRVGIANGERMLQGMAPFQPDDYLVDLGPCIPRRVRGHYFKSTYLSLLDQPNDRRSVYGVYTSLRHGLDLAETRRLIIPLLGFDVKLEPGSVFHAVLRDDVRKRWVLQQWLSLAYHLAQTTALESLSLSSWKHATFRLVKEGCARGETPFGDLAALFDDQRCEQCFREQGRRLSALLQAKPVLGTAFAEEVPRAMADLLQTLQAFALHPHDEEEEARQERAVCQAAGVVGSAVLRLLSKPGAAAVAPGAQEEVYLGLLLVQSNWEKLGESGDGSAINRVDVSNSLNSLELVLSKVTC